MLYHLPLGARYTAQRTKPRGPGVVSRKLPIHCLKPVLQHGVTCPDHVRAHRRTRARRDRPIRFGRRICGNAVDMAELTRRPTRSVLRGREQPQRAKPWRSRAPGRLEPEAERDVTQDYYWWRLERDFFGLTPGPAAAFTSPHVVHSADG